MVPIRNLSRKTTKSIILKGTGSTWEAQQCAEGTTRATGTRLGLQVAPPIFQNGGYSGGWRCAPVYQLLSLPSVLAQIFWNETESSLYFVVNFSIQELFLVSFLIQDVSRSVILQLTSAKVTRDIRVRSRHLKIFGVFSLLLKTWSFILLRAIENIVFIEKISGDICVFLLLFLAQVLSCDELRALWQCCRHLSD